MQRLSNSTLARLPESVARPAYDRSALLTGIVHLGLGAFHRAHEAIYTEAAVARGDLRWGIAGANLRSRDMRDALAPQDFLYTVAARDSGSETLQVVGVLRGVRVGADETEQLLQLMANPEVRIVSLTVTEKGYGLDPATGDLDTKHPDIQQDLANPQRPRSALGYLVEALRRRQAGGLQPFTVLCCDNLAHNGATVARLVQQFAELRDAALARYIGDHGAFPSTMLDRIVPATTEADRAHIAQQLGVHDAAPVVAERHNRWVVEDRFSMGRPRWDEVGVEMVGDIGPYEAMKLQLLNASHSALAYLGSLAGRETIADAIHDPVFSRFVFEMTEEEVIPTLNLPAHVGPRRYRDEMLERFRNRAIRHRTAQIAMDGSQKLPPRLLSTIRARLAVGAPFPRLAYAVAGWMRYVTGIDERGKPFEVVDPLAQRIAEICRRTVPHAPSIAAALLNLVDVFGSDLPRDARFREAVTGALERLYAVGAHRALAELNPSAAPELGSRARR